MARARVLDRPAFYPGRMLRRGDLVGRADELTMLADSLVATRGGTGGLVLVTGEPGIGKTRLAQELAELADRQGIAAVWGRCREDGGAPAYFPWVQIVKRVAEKTGLAADELDQRWPEIASLVRTTPSMTAPAVDPAERFRLFASVASLLDHCAKSRALVVSVLGARRRRLPGFASQRPALACRSRCCGLVPPLRGGSAASGSAPPARAGLPPALSLWGD